MALMQKRNQRAIAIGGGISLAIAGIAVVVPQFANAQEDSSTEQLRVASIDGEWVKPGDPGFAAAMGAWSDDQMVPGNVRSRSYLVRNMDARPGVWTVNLGDNMTMTPKAFFNVGSSGTNAAGGTSPTTAGPAPTAPDAPAPTDDGVTWLAGPDIIAEQAAKGNDITSAGPGDNLLTITVESCQAVAITDWVGVPDSYDDTYPNQQVNPAFTVDFVPTSGDPEEFQNGYCDWDESTLNFEPPVGEPMEESVLSPEDGEGATAELADGSTLPDWLTLGEDGSLTGTPPDDTPVTFEVEVTAEDGSKRLVTVTIEPVEGDEGEEPGTGDDGDEPGAGDDGDEPGTGDDGDDGDEPGTGDDGDGDDGDEPGTGDDGDEPGTGDDGDGDGDGDGSDKDDDKDDSGSGKDDKDDSGSGKGDSGKGDGSGKGDSSTGAGKGSSGSGGSGVSKGGSGTSSGGGKLAATGVEDIAVLAAGSGLLIALGLALVGIRRRRNN